MRCEVSFQLYFCNTQRQQINPSLLRTIDAIAHVRSTMDVGGGFLTSEHRLRPGKEGVPPCPITDGQQNTLRNPVQSGQRLPQRTDDPTPPGGGIRIAGLPLVFAGVGLELSEKKGVAIVLGVRRWWSSLPCLKLVL